MTANVELEASDDGMPRFVVQEWRFDEKPRGPALVNYLRACFPRQISEQTLEPVRENFDQFTPP